jgi:hypothetical protein
MERCDDRRIITCEGFLLALACREPGKRLTSPSEYDTVAHKDIDFFLGAGTISIPPE